MRSAVWPEAALRARGIDADVVASTVKLAPDTGVVPTPRSFPTTTSALIETLPPVVLVSILKIVFWLPASPNTVNTPDCTLFSGAITMLPG